MKISKKLRLAASVAFICVCVTSAIALVTLAHSQAKKGEMVSTIAFVSSRHQPSADPSFDMVRSTEIYLMDGDGTNVRRLTDNSYGDWFPSISPDGKTIVFDSNRLTAGTGCGGTTSERVFDASSAWRLALRGGVGNCVIQ